MCGRVIVINDALRVQHATTSRAFEFFAHMRIVAATMAVQRTHRNRQGFVAVDEQSCRKVGTRAASSRHVHIVSHIKKLAHAIDLGDAQRGFGRTVGRGKGARVVVAVVVVMLMVMMMVMVVMVMVMVTEMVMVTMTMMMTMTMAEILRPARLQEVAQATLWPVEPLTKRRLRCKTSGSKSLNFDVASSLMR